MKTQAVDRDHWIAFANEFSRSHDGWSGSLDVREPGAPMRIEVDESPFRGVTVEERDGHDTLVFTFGYEPEEHFAHIVHEPRTVATAETDDGSSASIIVENIDGTRCVLALWNPMREEEPAHA